MAWSISDKGEGFNDKQSILFQEYLDVLVAGVQSVDCVLDGCAVTAQGSPDMTVAVAAGTVRSNNGFFSVAAGNVTISAADGTNPRIDLVVVNSSGTKAARTGTAAASPKPAAKSANDVVLAAIYVPASDTTLETDHITDLRVLRPFAPRTKALGSDHAISATSATEVTGLGPMVLEPGTYTFKFSVIVQSATATVSPKLGINFTGTSTVQNFIWSFADLTTAITAQTFGMDDEGVNTFGYISGMASRTFTTTAPNFQTTVATAVAAINTNIICFIEGVLVVTAVGDLELWHGSETATSTTVKAGSSLVVQRTG